jgi:hypothetical protein
MDFDQVFASLQRQNKETIRTLREGDPMQYGFYITI